MSLLQKVTSLFARKQLDQAPVDAVPPAAATSPAPPPSDSVIYIYSHGFTNGVYRVAPDNDSFERFLEHSNQTDRLKEQQAVMEKAIAETELKLNAAKLEQATDTGIFIEKEQRAGHFSVTLAEMEQRRSNMEQQEVALTTQARETVSEYPWVPALLYFSAGITFIIADISITKQITSWGFDMTGWQGWIFAIGLAFTAFLIKPTIDRLFEKPFQTAGFKLKTIYKCVLLGITALGLMMLFCLGKFRSDSERAKNETSEILAQMSDLPPDSPEYRILQQKYDTIQKSLDDNTMGQTGLILSGLLFAVGGAICLSVSFGSLNQLMNRYWFLPAKIRHKKKEMEILRKDIAALQLEHSTITTDREKAKNRLSANEATILNDELKKLWEERTTLLSDLYQAQYEKERALYMDGKSKGERYKTDGELIYKIPDNDHSSVYLGKKEEKQEGPSPVRPYTRRPFVKMRKMIADNFNKNQSTQTYDGTEFEIVS